MRFVSPLNGDRLLTPLEMDQARQQAEQKNLKLAEKLRELGIDSDLL